MPTLPDPTTQAPYLGILHRAEARRPNSSKHPGCHRAHHRPGCVHRRSSGQSAGAMGCAWAGEYTLAKSGWIERDRERQSSNCCCVYGRPGRGLVGGNVPVGVVASSSQHAREQRGVCSHWSSVGSTDLSRRFARAHGCYVSLRRFLASIVEI